MHLYFGPNHRYFFDDGKGNFKYRAPPAFIDVFRTVRMSKIHHVSFGMEDSFFISYTRADNGVVMHRFQHDNHYEPLKQWLFDDGLTHDATLYVSLGLNDAFFARSNQGHRWRNIPADALDYYQKFTQPNLFLTQRVDCIDLGYQDTYMGTQVDGGWFWDLGTQYPRFESLGLTTRMSSAQNAMISAFAPDQHFVTFNDGSIHYSLPHEWAADIAQLFQTYASQTQTAQQAPQYGTYSPYPAYSPPLPQQQQQQAQQGQSFDVNEAMHLANNVMDAYNNATNAGGQTSGSTFDINQAMNNMQNSVQTINNVAGYAGQGVDLFNQLSNSGLMVGQLAGAAAACIVM